MKNLIAKASQARNLAHAAVVAAALFAAPAAFAGYCGSVNPYASQIDQQTCRLQTTRANCTGECTWYRNNGYPAPFCTTVNPGDTIMAPICNGYKTPETCNNNPQICVWN